MEKPRYVIIAELIDGSLLKAFRWTKDAESGIALAWSDAKKAGLAFMIKNIVAEELY